jgi:hypothetical protein
MPVYEYCCSGLCPTKFGCLSGRIVTYAIPVRTKLRKFFGVTGKSAGNRSNWLPANSQ